MKMYLVLSGLLMTTLLSSCEVIEGIFKADFSELLTPVILIGERHT